MTTNSLDSVIELEDAVWTWIQTLNPAMEVIWQRHSGIQPDDPFLTLNLIASARQTGARDETQYLDAGMQMVGRRECDLSINGYGDAAYAFIFALKQALDTYENAQSMSALNIAVVNHGDVLDLSALRDVNFQRRGQIDLRISYTTSRVTGPGYVEKVEITDTNNGDKITVVPG